MRHHDLGQKLCVEVFGEYFSNSAGQLVSVHEVALQHVEEDFGFQVEAARWTEIVGKIGEGTEVGQIHMLRPLPELHVTPERQMRNCVRKFGGVETDYALITTWFDDTESYGPGHGMFRHHAEGIFMSEQVFGPIFKRDSDGKIIPVRYIGEAHMLYEFGRIPTIVEWLQSMPIQAWQSRGAKRLSEEYEKAGLTQPVEERR